MIETSYSYFERDISERPSPKSVSMRLLVPAFFLVLLGLGNIMVGSFKYAQYEEVLRELSAEQTIESIQYLSPLQRLKYTLDTPTSIISLQKKAEARMDFYSLVRYGGEVFLCLSLLFFAATGLVKYLKLN